MGVLYDGWGRDATEIWLIFWLGWLAGAWVDEMVGLVDVENGWVVRARESYFWARVGAGR